MKTRTELLTRLMTLQEMIKISDLNRAGNLAEIEKIKEELTLLSKQRAYAHLIP